jgi:hypothetical protein
VFLKGLPKTPMKKTFLYPSGFLLKNQALYLVYINPCPHLMTAETGVSLFKMPKLLNLLKIK